MRVLWIHVSPLTCWAQLCLSPRAQALDVLAHHDSDKLRRRALRLFTDKVRLLRGELESLADLPLRDRTAHEERLAASALLPCALLEQQAASALSPLAKQALLAAVGASAVLMSSGDKNCSAAAGGYEVTWRRFAALRWRRHVGAALHFRLREGLGDEHAALAVAP